MKAIFLDLYGTLMDPESDRAAHHAMVLALADRFRLTGEVEDLSRDLEAFRERFFYNDRGFWTGKEVIEDATVEFLQTHGVRPTAEDMTWWRGLYLATHRQHLRLYPDAQDFLCRLQALPLHRGLISDIDTDFLALVREALGLDAFLHSFTSSEEVGATKPDPRPFRAALAKAGVAPEEAIHVGDRPDRDVLGARGVGMRTILRRRSPGLPDGGADHAVDDLRHALPIVQGYMEGLR